MLTVRNYFLLLSVLLLSGNVHSAKAGDINMGRDIAEEYCVQCHNVGVGGAFKMDPPSFAAIAKFRTAEQVRQRIEIPTHQDMPRYSEYMIGGNIDDMVAYIMSLEN